MNNPYQNPQQRPPQYPQGYPPPQYQQYQGAPMGQQQGRGSYQQGPNQHPIPSQMQQNSHALFQQYASSGSSPQYAKQGEGQIYFPPPSGLMSPPQLQQHDDTVDVAKTSNMMHQSSNQNQVRDIVWGSQEQNNAFWQQKFFLIYEKFEWFGSRFQMLKGEYFALTQQLQTVDSEDDWNQLKQHHEEFAQKLEEMFQELIAVADQNQQLINQRLQEDDGIWERRYHELLSNFKALQEKSSVLEEENSHLKTNPQQQEPSAEQQNYPELLSHYRNLEEQYEKLYNAYNKLQEENDMLVKANGQGGKNSNGPSLQDFQNMRVEYQRTLQTIHNQNEQLKTECQGFYQENQHLRHQLTEMSQMLAQHEHMSKALQEKDSLASSLNGELNQLRKQCQELEKQLSREEERNRQTGSKVRELEIQLTKQEEKRRMAVKQVQLRGEHLQHEIQSKQSQLAILSKKLQTETNLKQTLLHDHQEQLSKAIKLTQQKHIRQKQLLQQQLKTLQEQFNQLNHKYSEKDVGRYQIQMMEKRLDLMRDQNEQLIAEIKGKNQELIALRGVSLQLNTYENILEQYRSLQKQKLSIEESNRKMQKQLSSVKNSNSHLQHQLQQIRSLSSSNNNFRSITSTTKHFQSEIQLLQENNSKLQSQANKYKQLLASKQSYVKQIEEEQLKLLAKIQHQERVSETEKMQAKNLVISLQRKIDNLEKRNRQIQLQFKRDMVDNYQREIKQLRTSNMQKLAKVKQLQQSISELNIRLASSQKHSSTNLNEHQLLVNKVTLLESTNGELLEKLHLSHASLQQQEHQLASMKEKDILVRNQLNSTIVQLQQADQLIKSKNQIILQYQNQVKEFVQKVQSLQGRIDGQRKDKLQKVKKLQEQIQKLKDRIYGSSNNLSEDYNRRDSGMIGSNHYRYSSGMSTYSNRYLTFGTKQPINEQRNIINQPRNQQLVKLQNNLIEQLNDQNQKQRQEILSLTKKINQLESLSRVIANNLQPQSPTKSKISIKNQTNPNIPQRDIGPSPQLEKRLQKFNERLENCIQDNQLIDARGVDMTASQRVIYYEREKRQLQIAYERQISELNRRIKELEVELDIAKANNKPSSKANIQDSDLKEFERYEVIQETQQKSTQEELQFLKAKLAEQQKINSTLIKLNQHLKQQLEQALKTPSHSTTEYYKLQWKQTQKFLEEQKVKTKKLSEENKKFKHQSLGADSKAVKEYQIKLFQHELKIKQLERQVTYHKMVKTRAQNQRANLLHDVHVYSADIQNIKNSSQAKIAQYERTISELKQKLAHHERQDLQSPNAYSRKVVNSRVQKSGFSSRKVLV